MEFRTKREAMEMLARLNSKAADRRDNGCIPIEEMAEAAHIRALLPNLPD